MLEYRVEEFPYQGHIFYKCLYRNVSSRSFGHIFYDL